MNQTELKIKSKAIIDAIQAAEKIVITSHKSPDGDSIGSSMGLFHLIRKMDKNVVVCHPDKAADFLLWVEGTQEIELFDDEKDKVTDRLLNADLIFCLDYNTQDRVGDEMGEVLKRATAKKILIDHHLNPGDFADITFSYPEVGSTSELIMEVIENSSVKDLLDEKIGSPLYLGIMTDTGSFRFPSVTSRTHYFLGKLLDSGVVHYAIHEQIYDTNTVNRLKLRGYAISEKLELINEFKVAVISLNESELNRFNYQKGDVEGLVNMALSIDGVKAAAFFLEKDGMVKISFRSKGNYEVNVLASDHFEGGGHKYASGGISKTDMQTTIEKFKSVLPYYFAN